MKKFLSLILFVLIVVAALIFFMFRDKPKDFIKYEQYQQTLSSFETDYGTMKYRDEGQGQTILLVHGVPTNSWMYRNLADELVASEYRVVVPDLMGFGASDRMEYYDDYDFGNQADILVSLMDSLGINDWQQVTHDMGGLVTWHMLQDVSERINHLYVLNTIVYEESFNPPADFSYDNKVHRWILNQHEHPIIGKLIINNMLKTGTNKHSFSPSDKAGYWLPIRDGVGALTHFFTHTKEIKEDLDEYRSWLTESKIPVSVIWGEDDPFLDVSSVIFLRNDLNLTDEDILVLPGTKHLIAEESYQEIAAFINEKNN